MHKVAGGLWVGSGCYLAQIFQRIFKTRRSVSCLVEPQVSTVCTVCSGTNCYIQWMQYLFTEIKASHFPKQLKCDLGFDSLRMPFSFHAFSCHHKLSLLSSCVELSIEFCVKHFCWMYSISNRPSVIALLLISFAAFAEALEAVDCGSEEEAGHDSCHWDRDTGKDDDEEVSEGEGTTALPKTLFRE